MLSVAARGLSSSCVKQSPLIPSFRINPRNIGLSARNVSNISSLSSKTRTVVSTTRLFTERTQERFLPRVQRMLSITPFPPSVFLYNRKNLWQEALYRNLVKKSDDERLVLGMFASLEMLPAGMGVKYIPCPREFPTLESNQLLACYADRGVNKPLIGCFQPSHIEEIQTIYEKGFFLNTEWVILTLSDKNLKDFEIKSFLEFLHPKK